MNVPISAKEALLSKKAKYIVTRNLFENTEPECLILNSMHVLTFFCF